MFNLLFTPSIKHKYGEFSFPCDRDGNIKKDENYDVWRNKYLFCKSHQNIYIPKIIKIKEEN